MARLPVPGGDEGQWGDVLNQYLLTSHANDGTLRPSAIASKADDAAVVHIAGNETVSGIKTFTFSPILPAPVSAADAVRKDYVDTVVAAAKSYSPATIVVAPVGSATKADYYTDGISDDVQIQAAINSLPAAGGKILLKQGTYNISAPIIVSLAKGFVLEGEGWTTVLFAVDGLNGNIITFNPTSSGIWCRIAHLKIDHNGANQTAGNGIFAKGAIQCVFDSLWFTRPWGNGVHLFQDGNGGTGHHNRFIGCLFDNGNVTNGGDGRALRLEASDENMVVNCDFESNGRHGATEPNHIYDRSGLQHIVGSVFVGGETGVKLEGSYSRVIGCMFDSQSNHAIRLNGGGNIISSNTIYKPGINIVSPTYDGVWVDNISNAVIANNVFLSDSTGTRSGVNFANGSTNCLCEGNMFLTQGSGYGTSAVIVGTGNVVVNNRGFNSQGTAAIVVTASPFTYTTGATAEVVYVSGGTVSSIVKNGITLFSQSNVSIALSPNSSIIVTYSVPPTMNKDRQ